MNMKKDKPKTYVGCLINVGL